ncbi:CENP-Q, a CENPA-CAD centromere complex subunit-domain-containing protein [Hypoxylon sp. FL1284]|nr:CENP-Q, a CENPA-CAD centromere complex subunit-domain-containing protein [Hypoxylon sp. FL1284]
MVRCPATEVANQKRKRGRPTNASRDDDEGNASGAQSKLTKQGQIATTSENIGNSDMDESARPRKRGRPANTSAHPEPEPEPEPEATRPSKSRRKRRPSPVAQPDENGDDERDEEPELHQKPENPQRKKRGRPRTSNGSEQNEERDNTAAAGEAMLSKKRGRPPKESETGKDKEVAAEEADDENEGNSSILRRSGRIRRSPDAPNNNAQVAQAASEQRPAKKKSKTGAKRDGALPNERPEGETEQDSVSQPKRKRGRPSLSDRPPSDAETNAEPQNQPKRRGRPSLSGENASSSTKSKGKKPRNEPSHEEEAPEEEERPPRGRRRSSNNEQRKQRKRRRPSDEQARSSSPDSGASPARYRHLTTRTRRVPREVIETKWTPLEGAALTSVGALLQSASRPVLLHAGGAPRRQAQARAALAAVGGRLRRKVARGLPFPPPAGPGARREDELAFDRTVAGVQALESQLDPLLHGVDLLRRERDRAQRDLDRDYRALARLAANARAEARQRRDQARKMHVLVQDRPPQQQQQRESGEAFLPADKGSGRVFADLGGDEELGTVAGQIASHMESMRGNLLQMDGVVPEIAKSRGLLRAALQAHLDPEQLEDVTLG